MLSPYIRMALKLAQYERLDDGTYYGEIPGFTGVFSNAANLEDCREQLQEVLEGWITLGLQQGHQLPIVHGIDLSMHLNPV